jgi:hypothetical protein
MQHRAWRDGVLYDDYPGNLHGTGAVNGVSNSIWTSGDKPDTIMTKPLMPKNRCTILTVAKFRCRAR